MSEFCDKCNSKLDEKGNCPECGGSSGREVQHIVGGKVTGDLEVQKKDMPRTRPVQPKGDIGKPDTAEPSLDELEDVPELSPEDIKIDFDKIDTSTLFDEDFDDVGNISAKILPQRQRPREERAQQREL
jgi:hypothetical protein